MLFFMLINIKMVRGAQSPLGLFCSIAAKGLFAQLPLGLFCSIAAGLFCSIAARALSLRCCSCRKGISFLLPEQKKRNKENSPSALFGLLRHFSTLNKKNSLRSNSFLFLTLQHSPPLHAQKVRPDLTAFLGNIASLVGGVVFSLFNATRLMY